MDFVQKLKEQARIEDVVGEHVRLKKSGVNYSGLCPFHSERTPSFSVSSQKGIYHCFGCQKGGDVISFIQEIEGVSFQDAVRNLAMKLGVSLPEQFKSRMKRSAEGGHSKADELEVYYKLNRFVAQFYYEQLWSDRAKSIQNYLVKRGLSEHTIKSAYLGFAPNDWAELYHFLVQKKAPIELAEKVGLIRKKPQQTQSDRMYYDLFRNRVIFPIIDARGRVIAFGGRVIDAEQSPKYLNSSESLVFKKGFEFYGLQHAQKHIRAEGSCIIVEGFMDCLALHQAGLGHTVATLGTALTEEQVKKLKRITSDIILLFDGDTAGQEAQFRAMEAFLKEDIVVKSVTLPAGNDPDDFVKERGSEALLNLVKDAPYLLDQRILGLASGAGTQGEARAKAIEQVIPWLAYLSSDTARMVRVQELAYLFHLKPEFIESKVREERARRSKDSKPKSNNANDANNASVLQRQPLVVKPLGATGTKGLGAKQLSTKLDVMDAKLIELLVLYPWLSSEMVEGESILEGLEMQVAQDLAVQLMNASSALRNGAFSREILEWTQSENLRQLLTMCLVKSAEGREKAGIVREFEDLKQKLIKRGLERRKDRLRAVIMKEEGLGKVEQVQKLMKEYNELVRTLERTNKREVGL